MPTFGSTRWSIVARAEQDDALESLCASYWEPVCAFVRSSGVDAEAAKDITQTFFVRLVEKGIIGRANPEVGKFRTFLLSILKHHLADWKKSENCWKRGGRAVRVPLELNGAEGLASAAESPEQAFDRHWAEALMERAAARLRHETQASAKAELFSVLTPFLSEEPQPGNYAQIGDRFGMKGGTIAMAVHRLRHRFGELIRAEVADTLADAGDIEEEMAALRAALRG